VTTPALKLDPHNANRGTDRGRRAVADSLAECGAGRSILVDRDGTVIAGNKTLEAAQALGLPVWVVESSGDELVVVQRTDLELDGEDQRARRLAYLDNRAGQLGLDWDTDQILADLEAGVDLSGLWDDTELDEMLGGIAAAADAADAAAAPRPTLADRFLVPPFSVLDARQGYWQERKRAWLALGIRSELGRGGSAGEGSGDGKRFARCFGQDLMRGEHVLGTTEKSGS
jgi:hypothetical protein